MTPEAEEIEEESFRIIEEKLKGISPPKKEVVKFITFGELLRPILPAIPGQV